MGFDGKIISSKVPNLPTEFNQACFVRVYANLAAAGITGVTQMITYGGQGGHFSLTLFCSHNTN
jgi:hypothetical protein